MEYLDSPFEVSTGSGRRPTPLIYEHLRDYPALVKQYLRLSSQTDITNVNDILNLTGNLYVSNEISRVIAQLVGQKDPGFITIKGTADGALHVYPAGGAEAGKTDVKVADGDNVTIGAIADAIVAAGAAGTLSAKLRRLTQGLEDLKTLTTVADGGNATIGAIADANVAAGATGTLSSKLRRATQGLEDLKTLVVLAAGTNLIGNVKVAGTSQTELSAPINIATATTHDIIAVAANKSHHITSILFTVAGEVDVTLRDETGVLSGAMDFGGTDEPRGMAQNFGLASLKCTSGEKFQILLSAAIQVSGVVTYYDE